MLPKAENRAVEAALMAGGWGGLPGRGGRASPGDVHGPEQRVRAGTVKGQTGPPESHLRRWGRR